MNRLTFIIALICSIQTHAQKFIGNNGEISFFSEAPIENITAVNNKVSAVFDLTNHDLVFQLNVEDFIFRKALMQEHFNENYLESDIYPKSFFVGKLLDVNEGRATVQGDLTIHGITNKIKVDGVINQNGKKVNISANFIVKLEDYDIKVPKIVMYKIAETIDIEVNIELKEIR